MEQKYACLLYRTKTTEQKDQAEMERQRGVCLQFAQEQGWLPIREFWCSEEDGHPINEDPLLELRAGAEQAQFQILLVSEFDRIGRVQWNAALLRPFLSDMVLRSGRQRMDTWENLSDSKPQRCDRFRNTISFKR